MAEEIKDPEKNVPKAILFAFAVCSLVYIGVSIVAVGVVNWQTARDIECAAGVCIEDRHR